MLINFNDLYYNTLCFPLYLEKVENGATFLETMMIIGSNNAELGYHLKFVTTN